MARSYGKDIAQIFVRLWRNRGTSHIARSVYKTLAAAPGSMTALAVSQKSMIHMSGTLEPGGGSRRTSLGARYVPLIVSTRDVGTDEALLSGQRGTYR